MSTLSQEEVDTLRLHRRLRTGLIARQNDLFRQSDDNQLVMLTSKVEELPDQDAILRTVREYDSFDEPHSEHDFGKFDWNGTALVWKIDCYDSNGLWISWVDPQDPKCVRALTVMLAEEY